MPDDSTSRAPDPHPPDRGGARGEFVAIDLETTGLDRAADRITEVGATRFDRSGALSTFQSLVNPGRPIPRQVQELTGISDDTVAGAPTITAVGAELAAYVGDSSLVGQNVSFDLDFLEAAGVLLRGPAYDTLDLASVLLPTASRLDLGSLIELLGVQVDERHRALADAEATRDVFLRLLELLERLPRSALLELRAIAASAEWTLGQLFEDAIERRDAAPQQDSVASAGATSRPEPPAPTLTPREPPLPVTAEDVERLFQAVAERPELLADFEPRAGQVRMAQAVAGNIAAGGHLVVEAGTGIGKSLAYLLPAFLHALRNGDRVLVSTHTLNLQEQLAQQDIPIAAAAVEADQNRPGGTLRAAVLKGRSNYLCLERWAEVRDGQRPRTLAEARLHARITVWLPHTGSGDMAELYMPSAQRPAWSALAADSNDCLARRCPYVRDGSCFLLRARQRAAAAHVVVVNHALLLTTAARSQVLPPFRQLVIDEAHHLEDVATQQYGATLSLRDLETLLDEFRAADGAAGSLRAAATVDDSPLSAAAGLVAIADAVIDAAQRAQQRIPALTDTLRAFAAERAEDDGEPSAGRRRDGDLSLTSARHSQPLWADVEESAIQLDVTLLHLGERLERAREAASALAGDAAPDLGRVQAGLARAAEAVATARGTLGDSVLHDDAGQIVWLGPTQQEVRLNVAPLEVAGRLAEDLYAECDSVTVTSATLTASGSFDFSAGRLGLEEPETLQVPSPFDYRQAVLVLAVEDVPEPNAPGYAAEAHRTLVAAAAAAGGRTLALFTSRSAVRAAADAVRQPLGGGGIGVLAQELDGPPARLLRALAEQPRTLVLGTAALWDGIDVRGEALSQIVVARLPFPVPTDPVYVGRAAAYDDPFNEYAVPRAVLRFRQGFGRLIRGSRERGVFLLLDSRVVSRRYGEAFLEALPECEVRRVPASAVGDAVADWLAR